MSTKRFTLYGLAVLIALGLVSSASAALEPLAVWDGDFSTPVKNGWTLSENGNTKADGHLEISGARGITLTKAAPQNVFTVIVRCTGLNLASNADQVLFTSYVGDSQATDQDLTGVYLPAGNAACVGLWQGDQKG